jgi:hypothetical protein
MQCILSDSFKIGVSSLPSIISKLPTPLKQNHELDATTIGLPRYHHLRIAMTSSHGQGQEEVKERRKEKEEEGG